MDVLLTLTEASEIAQVDENLLHQLVQSGKLKASMMSTGQIVVSKEELQGQLPRELREEYKRYAHLAGHGISMRQASLEYSVPHQTISRWVDKGYIQVIGDKGKAVLIDQADVAYCAEVYHQNPGQGKWTTTKLAFPSKKS